MFVFALHLVLSEEKAEKPGKAAAQPSIGNATYPLAVPQMESAPGLVAIVSMAVARRSSALPP